MLIKLNFSKKFNKKYRLKSIFFIFSFYFENKGGGVVWINGLYFIING